MLNKIDLASASTIRRIEARNSDPKSTSEGTSNLPANAAKDVTTSLSERALSLAKASPEINASRIDQIKQAISSGEFSIDAKAVARAFIAMENT